ncbi:hypothetical protein C1H46_030325 [Malus baccata]|uniref:Uncharacterized protein n=1 Tax=Malus baccata TaxID=106549 RepID=A0A540LCC4_MALBA|nr:hypothetical protein C1H46_030325 [Malus baccata]
MRRRSSAVRAPVALISQRALLNAEGLYRRRCAYRQWPETTVSAVLLASGSGLRFRAAASLTYHAREHLCLLGPQWHADKGPLSPSSGFTRAVGCPPLNRFQTILSAPTWVTSSRD